MGNRSTVWGFIDVQPSFGGAINQKLHDDLATDWGANVFLMGGRLIEGHA